MPTINLLIIHNSKFLVFLNIDLLDFNKLELILLHLLINAIEYLKLIELILFEIGKLY
jgi:hypothetical protein